MIRECGFIASTVPKLEWKRGDEYERKDNSNVKYYFVNIANNEFL